MKKIIIPCLLAFSFGSIGQVIPPVQPDTPIAGTVVNTGISVSPHPGNEVHATVFDDGFGGYKILWLDAAGNVVDNDANAGNDPDVAYYANPDALVVAYENGGGIYVDAFYLSTWSPVDYNMATTTPIAPGQYPNVDMNSAGKGVLCWEDGGTIWACTFGIGGFSFTPPTPVAIGNQPDIVLLDNSNDVVFTYIRPNGVWVTERCDYSALTTGVYANTGTWWYPPTVSQFEYPRIAGQRNAAYGPNNFFSAVAQERTGAGYNVNGIFFVGGMIGPNLINQGFQNCGTYNPKPVVTYDRDFVHVAWGQRYGASCSPIPHMGPGSDVLMATYDFGGNQIPSPTQFREVNQVQLPFYASSTSISAEYDGNYGVTGSDYMLGIVYNDPGDTFWKTINPSNPTLINAEDNGITPEANDVFSVTQDPVSATFEVLVDSKESSSFELYDNTGRKISSGTLSDSEKVYSLDLSQLPAGIYLLHCTTGNTSEVHRVFNNK